MHFYTIIYMVGALFYALLEHFDIHCWNNYLCTSTQFYTLLVHNSIHCWNTNFYVVRKLIFIHLTTNFYAMSAPKMFLRILTIDYESYRPSLAIFQFSNFREDEVSMFYACGFHILCIVPMLNIHPHSGKHDVVEAITVVSGGMSISWRGFYVVTKLIFIRSTTNFYAT